LRFALAFSDIADSEFGFRNAEGLKQKLKAEIVKAEKRKGGKESEIANCRLEIGNSYHQRAGSGDRRSNALAIQGAAGHRPRSVSDTVTAGPWLKIRANQCLLPIIGFVSKDQIINPSIHQSAGTLKNETSHCAGASG
jgi:hypothetical protein